MLFFRSKYILILFLIPGITLGFTDKSCLSNGFETIVSHKARPFGIFENTLKITKNFCLLDITVKKWEVWERKWSIDTCRLPVHIKYGTGAVDIYKRTGSCPSYTSEIKTTDFCEKLKELEKIILDEGLIFAIGLKEDLSSDHGKVYCSYQLIKGYLREGIIYGPESEYIFPQKEKIIEEVIKVQEIERVEESATPSTSSSF